MANLDRKLAQIEVGQMTVSHKYTEVSSLPAEQLGAILPGLGKAAQTIIEQEPLLDFVETSFLTSSALPAALAHEERLKGMRDELDANHGLVLSLLARLQVHHEDLPEPDLAIVEQLKEFGSVELDGKICLLDGVPIPAGELQLTFFIVMRWRPLFHPAAKADKVYLGDAAYDRIRATDTLQEPILGVTTKKYREQLAKIQQSEPDLFVALWFRRIDIAEAILVSIPNTSDMAVALFDVELKVSRTHHIILAAVIMSEWERLFEIADGMKLDKRVTREAVQKVLDAAQSWDDILRNDNEISRFLIGCVMHMRANHRSMNFQQLPGADTCMLVRVREALENSPAFQGKYRCVEHIGSQRPLRFFNGVELAKLFPVMFEQMHDNLSRWREDGGKIPIAKRVLADRKRKQIILAIIVTSNICDKTAQHMAKTLEPQKGKKTKPEMQSNSKKVATLSPADWKKIYLTALIAGSEGLDPVAEQKLKELSGNDVLVSVQNVASRIGQAFKSKLDDATLIAKECTSAIGEPGWTMGARFDAWLEPEAECEFLRKCTKPVLYSNDLNDKARFWEKTLLRRGRKSNQSANQIIQPIGLPTIHPVMHIHEAHPSIFEPLQFTGIIGSALMSRRWLMHEHCIKQAAARLPGLSPSTDDPWLSERLMSRPKQGSLAKHKRRNGGYKRYQIAYIRDYHWQRD